MDFAHVPTLLINLGRQAVWLVLLSMAFVPLEWLFAPRPRARRSQRLNDLGYYVLNGLLTSTLLSLPLSILVLAVHKVLPWSIAHAADHWNMWARAGAAMLIGEIGFYWGHRLSHEIPFLWRFHAIHHSAQQVDWLTNSRAHPLDMVFTRLCGFVPIFALGLADPLKGQPGFAPMAVLFISSVWSFFIHANLPWRFGPLEWLIATPAFHRWHHTNDGPDVIDKNYASMLPWLDWVFGTMFLPKGRMPVRYGIEAPMPSGFVDQLLHPVLDWRPAPAPRAAAGDPR